MLKDDFYTITSTNNESNTFKASLELNKSHKIFDGHFPGQPVVPGACLFQIVKELTETAVQQSLRLIKADDLKFLMVINPNENSTLQATIQFAITDQQQIKINATIHKNDEVCFKCKAVLGRREV